MKTTMFVLCFLCATTATFGQSVGVLSSQAQPVQMLEHPQHATEHAMAQESSLLSSNPYTYAKGEVPLADLASPTYYTPLGDIAREARKEHANARKAAKISED